MMNDKFYIEALTPLPFVPFQGSLQFLRLLTQGVALGWN